MPLEDKAQKSGPKFTKDDIRDDKGTEFVDPLAAQGARVSSGYRVIDTTKEPESHGDGDIRGDERRGAVKDNQAPIENASANRVHVEGG